MRPRVPGGISARLFYSHATPPARRSSFAPLEMLGRGLDNSLRPLNSMTSCIKLIAQFVPHNMQDRARTAECADFLRFLKVGTLLANWLKRDQRSLVTPSFKRVSNKRVKKNEKSNDVGCGRTSSRRHGRQCRRVSRPRGSFWRGCVARGRR